MQKKERNVGVCVLIVLCFAVVPLYLISGYAHPSADDYSYGAQTAVVWQNTGSVFQVLKHALKRTAYTYQTWQGTFSSLFLMRLQPAIFGEEYYFLTTVFLLTIFLLSSVLFYAAFFCRLFRASFWQGITLSGIFVFGALEFTHVPSDAFYWYNGGVTYTCFYAMEVCLAALLIFLYCAEKKSMKCLLGMVSMVLAFFTCGGNYVTSLVTVEILCFACLLLFVKRGCISEKKWTSSRVMAGMKRIFAMAAGGKVPDRITVLWFVLTLFGAAAGFLLAVAAPGNALRQAEVGKAMNPLAAVGISFIYGAYSMGNCMKLPVVVLFAACVPLMIGVVKKHSFSFRCPVVVTFFSYCLYSSQITPVIYAQGIKIPYRIMNIMYFSCFVMMAINLFYWLGYLYRQKKARLILENVQKVYEHHVSAFYLVVTLLFCFAAAGGIEITADVDMDKKTQVEITQMPASISAMYSLLCGEAKQYDQEAWERYWCYMDASQDKVVVKEFSVKPDLIFHTDITENPKHWKNKCVKKYFKKQSIVLEREE